MANSIRSTGRQLLEELQAFHIKCIKVVDKQRLSCTYTALEAETVTQQKDMTLTCRVQGLDTLLHIVKGHLPQHSNTDDPPSSAMHAVCRHGRLRHVAVLVEDASLICLTDQLGSTGTALGGIEGLQRVIELGIVKVTRETAWGLRVGMGCTPGTGGPPHVVCTAVGQSCQHVAVGSRRQCACRQ